MLQASSSKQLVAAEVYVGVYVAMLSPVTGLFLHPACAGGSERTLAGRPIDCPLLQSGEAPPPYRQPPAPAPPMPMSHPSMRPRRAAAARTNAAIDASLRVEAQTTRLGKMKKI